MSRTMLDFTSLLHPDATRFIEMIDQLGVAGWNTRYNFMPIEEYEPLIKTAPGKGMEIYWNEILGRAHLTAATAILRSRHWVDAVRLGATENNVLSFAAAFRGLIESAADSSTTLGLVPVTLARDLPQILQALSGNIGLQMFLAPALEDALIHYSYARHLTKPELQAAPPSHKALHVRDYIKVLEKGEVPNVIACYRALCDLTHPGATSVWLWLWRISDVAMELKASQDDRVIGYFLTEYRETLVRLLMFAFNPALTTLRVLNYFPLVELHTPALENWHMSGIGLWRKCHDHLKGIEPKVRGHLKTVKP
jgi:hypothetical protein